MPAPLCRKRLLTTAHPLGLLVRNLELRAPLSDADREALCGLHHTVRTLDASTYLVREGERPSRCAVLLSGFACRLKITGAGARQIMSVHMPGDALDLQNLFLDLSDHSVALLTRGEVALVPREAIRTLVNTNSNVAKAIFIKTLVEAAIVREWVVNVGRRNARERIAHLLCEFGFLLDALGLAEKYGYTLPMTQEQLADAVGLTPVHVNRTLKSLEAEGLISRKNRSINFPDWRAMRTAADFSARYLHMGRQAGAT